MVAQAGGKAGSEAGGKADGRGWRWKLAAELVAKLWRAWLIPNQATTKEGGDVFAGTVTFEWFEFFLFLLFSPAEIGHMVCVGYNTQITTPTPECGCSIKIQLINHRQF